MRLLGGGVCRETERQKLNNLISSPLFTSPPLSSLSRLLSFPHVCLLAVSLLSRPPARPSLPRISSRIFPPSRCPHLFTSPIVSHFLALVSYLIRPHLRPPPSVPRPPSPSSLQSPPCLSSSPFVSAVQISRSAHIFKKKNPESFQTV